MELTVGFRERSNEADALRLLGDVSAAGDAPDFDSASSYYERAKTLAEELGMRPLLARCHLGLGQAQRQRGNREAAARYLTTAAALFREMGMRFWLEKAEAEIAAVR